MEDHIIDELRHHLKDYVQMITRPSPGAGRDHYICPLPNCGSGTGRNRTGAFSIESDGLRWHCFSCHQGGDIFDLIGLMENKPTWMEQAKRAAEIFETSGAYTPPARAEIRPEPKPRKAQPGAFTDYINACAAAADKTNYFQKRGFTPETIARFRLGYDKSKDQIIIPYNKQDSYYIARTTTGKNFYKPSADKAGTEPVYNAAALAGDQPCFITESPIDAISIMQAGGAAVAISGTGSTKLLRLLEDAKPAATLIISLDNDDAGQTAAANLAEELNKRGISFIKAAYDLDKYQGDTKDANDLLLSNEGQLMQDIKDNVARAQLEPQEQDAAAANQTPEDAAAAEILAEIDRHKVGFYMEDFWTYIKDEANNKPTPTGFEEFDEAIGGGLFPRLYVLGAVTSLGKTTFALQIADHIAASGKDVIIFSLEMAKEDIMARSISRNTYLMADNEHHAKTELEILDGSRWKKYTPEEKKLLGDAMEKYWESVGDHISIYEGRHTADEIQLKVKQYVEMTGKRPVVIVDYIQILQPAESTRRGTSKEQMDYNIDVLTAIRREHKTPVIAISAFNRGSYNTAADNSSFKESGAIEYSADCVITMELDTADNDKDTFKAALQQNPRKIKLTLHKNRGNQVMQVLKFYYYPAFNFFNPVPPVKSEPAKRFVRTI